MHQQRIKQHCLAAELAAGNAAELGQSVTVCRSKQNSARRTPTCANYESSGQSHFQKVFLGEILTLANGQSWYINAIVRTRMVTFQVDTGTDVTVIPATDHSAQANGALYNSTEQLLGTRRWPIKMLGRFDAGIE